MAQEPKRRMTPEELEVLVSIKELLGPLLATCQKGGHAYQANPQLVADVNRTSKRLRLALQKVLQDQGVQDPSGPLPQAPGSH